MKFRNIDQYRKLAYFLYKYGTSDIIKNSGLSEVLEEDIEERKGEPDVSPEEMVRDLKEMGPAFIKFGQLLSTRPDILPAAYVAALGELQDNIDPFPFEQVKEIIEEQLGVRFSRAFVQFDEVPLASASLGQVHLAELHSGKKVVVKVQRPGIRDQILKELEVLETAGNLLEKNTRIGKQMESGSMIRQFKKTLLKEIDYLREARNMKTLHYNLIEYEHILVPVPVDDYTTDKVLTMEYLKGRKITLISPLKKMDINGDELVDELFSAYLKQIVIDGFMHADPHPGNIHITDNNCIALLDMGMVAHISEYYREKYLRLLLYVGDGKADKVAEILMDISHHQESINKEKFRMEISDLIQENRNMTVQNLQTGKLIFALIRAAGNNGLRLPMELNFVGKALLNLDQVGLTIAPGFSPDKALRKHTVELMRKHIYKDFSSQNFLSMILESKNLLEAFPERLNKILQKAADNELSLKVDAFDEKHLMQGFQKVANRITLGLILAALVIGSSLLMRVPTSFTLFGYPGFAIVSFLAAVAGTVYLALKIFFKDE